MRHDDAEKSNDQQEEHGESFAPEITVVPETGNGSGDRGHAEAEEFKVFDKRFWAENETASDSGSTEPRAEVPSYVQKLQAEVEEKDRRLREYIAAYKTEVAEKLEQTKARLERDSEQQIKALRGQFADPMMEVFDALERSLHVAQGSADVQAVVEGIDRVRILMLRKLEDLGIDRIEAVGQPFDPSVHEAVAVAQVDDPAQNGVVLAELAPGFRCGGRVVRATKVQVGKA